MADDWTSIGWGGVTTKKAYLAGVKSGQYSSPIIKYGPIDVKLLGNVAVVQGSNIETDVPAGQKVIWTDVWVKRQSKWVLVRSQVGVQ